MLFIPFIFSICIKSCKLSNHFSLYFPTHNTHPFFFIKNMFRGKFAYASCKLINFFLFSSKSLMTYVYWQVYFHSFSFPVLKNLTRENIISTNKWHLMRDTITENVISQMVQRCPCPLRLFLTDTFYCLSKISWGLLTNTVNKDIRTVVSTQ